MKPKLKKVTKLVTRYEGLTDTAAQLGVSTAHLSYVLHGKRTPGKALAEKLRDMGVELPEVTPTIR